MPSYEIVYFDFPGRAEALRVMLHAAGIEFTDTRIKNWPEVKPTTPLGSLPLLKVDGVTYCQSVALYRYAAKLVGWYPEDPLQALAVDEAMDSINELASKAPQASTEEEKKVQREEFQKTVMTKYASMLEQRIEAAGGSGFLASGICVADLFLEGNVTAIETGFWDFIDPKFFEAYPGIMKTVQSVRENTKVKAYYASIAK